MVQYLQLSYRSTSILGWNSLLTEGLMLESTSISVNHSLFLMLQKCQHSACGQLYVNLLVKGTRIVLFLCLAELHTYQKYFWPRRKT